MDLSVIIPVYRSERTLPQLAERLHRVLGTLGLDYEIVFVNDDSPDGAWGVIEDLQRNAPDRTTAIRLMRNFGQHNALMCGMRWSTGRVVVTMDDDLQHPPEQLPKLLDALKTRDLDVVYGRYDRKKHAGWRNLGSSSLNLVYRMVCGVDVQFSAFRAIRREVVDAALTYDRNFAFIDGILTWNTTRIGEVTVEHEQRHDGRSGYSIRKLAILALNMVTNFSLLPLQFASLLGLTASASGLLIGLYYLWCSFTGSIVVPGYASTVTAILFLGGIQLLAVGIIGEYVGRIHLNVNRKPQYREREVVSRTGARSSTRRELTSGFTRDRQEARAYADGHTAGDELAFTAEQRVDRGDG